jgi:hypothetical protein
MGISEHDEGEDSDKTQEKTFLSKEFDMIFRGVKITKEKYTDLEPLDF